MRIKDFSADRMGLAQARNRSPFQSLVALRKVGVQDRFLGLQAVLEEKG